MHVNSNNRECLNFHVCFQRSINLIFPINCKGVLLILIPAIVFLLLIGFVATKAPQIKGILGESYVKTLLSHLDAEECVVLHDILLPYKGGTTQVDHVVLSPYGVHVIETKNYKGWIFGKENQRNWT